MQRDEADRPTRRAELQRFHTIPFLQHPIGSGPAVTFKGDSRTPSKVFPSQGFGFPSSSQTVN